MIINTLLNKIAVLMVVFAVHPVDFSNDVVWKKTVEVPAEMCYEIRDFKTQMYQEGRRDEDGTFEVIVCEPTSI